jgi:hypothetical protein
MCTEAETHNQGRKIVKHFIARIVIVGSLAALVAIFGFSATAKAESHTPQKPASGYIGYRVSFSGGHTGHSAARAPAKPVTVRPFIVNDCIL